MKLLAKICIVFCLVYGNFAWAQYGSFTDKRDGKKYKTIKIRNIVWFAENLNYKAKGSTCYLKNEAYCQEYGRLYDSKTALNVCPKGTHLSTYQEWEILVMQIVGPELGAKKLKSSGGWHLDDCAKSICIDAEKWFNVGDRKEFYQWSPKYYCEHNGNGTNDIGFSILPAGYGVVLSENDIDALIKGRKISPTADIGFVGVGTEANFWISRSGGGFTIAKTIGVDDEFLWSGGVLGYKYLFSIRCVVDY